MKITELNIDGFGVWRDLRLDGLADGVNVFYGPNEAGKTTLLQFVRALLYGISPTQRARYLPPLQGGRAGGTIRLADAGGEYLLARHDDDPQLRPEGLLSIRSADGISLINGQLRTLLSGVDETIFHNVFAFGLRELQELGTLSDAQSAQYLYNLSTGLDRVSLSEVLRELRGSRNRLLSDDDRPSQIAHLTSERDRLARELDELNNSTREYARLARGRDQLLKQIARSDEEKLELDAELRVIEVATKLHPRWQERAALQAQLATLDDVQALPDGAAEELDELNERIRTRREQVAELKRRCSVQLTEARALKINEALWKLGPRIEALVDQSEWIVNVEGQIGELRAESNQLEAQLAAERLPWEAAGGGQSKLDERTFEALRPAARAARDAKRRWRKAQATIVACRDNAGALSREMKGAMSDREERELNSALEQAGERVSQLRHRVQLDERLDQFQAHRETLEHQHEELLEKQIMPVWTLGALGSIFVLGVTLILAGLFLPASITGPIGWMLAILGLGGAIVAGVSKVVMERAAAHELAICEKQLRMSAAQIQQAKEERKQLDAQLPRGGGPLLMRLQEAERELTKLEELVPLNGRRQALDQERQDAEEQANRARQAIAQSRKRWRQALQEAGLAPTLTPQQIKQLAGRREQVAELQRRLARRSRDLQLHQRSLESLTQRVGQLVAESGLPAIGGKPSEQLRILRAALQEQEALVRRRDELMQAAREARREQLKLARNGRRLLRRRRAWLHQWDVDSEAQFRQRVAQYALACDLRTQLAAIEREIATALEGITTEETLGEVLATVPPGELEVRWDELASRLAQCEQHLHELYEKRGELNQQLKVLAADRRLAERRLELEQVEARLAEAMRRWQVLCTTHRLLDSVRDEYERERQPETLREASRYLARLTRKRYGRVWTPLGEDVLRVDDADGRTLPVDVLSRGTREQLFLSLRLALVDQYARRGARLPLVLDDLLVNFDATRAKAAAQVLRDFAQRGHQMLVFTCHEHIAQLFKELEVDVRRLPNRECHPPAPVEAPPRKRRKKHKPVPVAAPEPVEEPLPTPIEVVVTATEPQLYPLEELEAEPPQHDPLFDPAYLGDESDDEEIAVEELPPPVPRPPRDESRSIRRGRTVWTAEGAEDFAGEFSERVVETIRVRRRRKSRKPSSSADSHAARTNEDDALAAAERLVEEEADDDTMRHVEVEHFVWQEVDDYELVDVDRRTPRSASSVDPTESHHLADDDAEAYDEAAYADVNGADDEAEAA